MTVIELSDNKIQRIYTMKRYKVKELVLAFMLGASLWSFGRITARAGSWEYRPAEDTYYYKEKQGYVTNRWVGAYYLKKDGRMAKNEWIYDPAYRSWYYLRANGSYARNEWISHYYLKKDGKMAKNEWFYDQNYAAWYYLLANGRFARNQWIDNRYYMKPNGKMACLEYLSLPSGNTVVDWYFGSTGAAYNTASGLQAKDLQELTATEVIERVGPLFTQDQKQTGILASISLAQFILESGYGKSELAVNANNCFGMKTYLSGNTWDGSSWDSVSQYVKKTSEETAGNPPQIISITAAFRRYPSLALSIKDHSAYLLGAIGDHGGLRYAGLSGETDARRAATIIKAGGYATSSTYVDVLCELIDRWNLSRFDAK